ncbi:unnamed protein product [Phytomonas sp. Hart1]|nr:unnamed protein product [Phytomonas sp. Hart1]|eukprot:CCW71378.1 unnamed protein product [Phytomonas sp. isolate Hart1]
MDLPALENAVCSRATDMFSLGASLYEILFRKRVYAKCPKAKCQRDNHTRQCFVPAAKQPILLPVDEDFTAAEGGGGIPITTVLKNPNHPSLSSLHHLIAALLNQNTKERITAAQCCEFVTQAFHFTKRNGN